jgi:hypothetical protein
MLSTICPGSAMLSKRTEIDVWRLTYEILSAGRVKGTGSIMISFSVVCSLLH